MLYDHMFNVCKQKHLAMATGGTPIININRLYIHFYREYWFVRQKYTFNFNDQ